jgi:Transposase family tnp2
VLAKALKDHAASVEAAAQAGDGYLRDITDGAAYKQAMYDERFRQCPRPYRNLQLGLAFDGVQPFKDDAKYSIWPIALTAFNLPPEDR